MVRSMWKRIPPLKYSLLQYNLSVRGAEAMP
jgi:hypothetical protein